MPAAKSLVEHVREGTFRSRRHHRLLAGPVVPCDELALLQARYARATSEAERRAVGVEFEQAVRQGRGRSQDELALDPDVFLVEEIFTGLPVPMTLYGEELERYYRAHKSATLAEAGLSVDQISSQLKLPAATVRADIRWFEDEHGIGPGHPFLQPPPLMAYRPPTTWWRR
jgi:hypothetical protein